MNLAVARRRMGDAAQAAAMLEAVAPQLANNEDPEASGIYHSALNNLATAYRELGRDADARRAWERLAGRLASVGDRESWARVSSNLSTLLADLGDLEAAERTARQAVDAWRVVRGDGDVDTALATVNLGSVLGARGQWAAAAESVAAGHAVLQQLLGPQHPSTQRAFEVLRVVSALGELLAEVTAHDGLPSHHDALEERRVRHVDEAAVVRLERREEEREVDDLALERVRREGDLVSHTERPRHHDERGAEDVGERAPQRDDAGIAQPGRAQRELLSDVSGSLPASSALNPAPRFLLCSSFPFSVRTLLAFAYAQCAVDALVGDVEKIAEPHDGVAAQEKGTRHALEETAKLHRTPQVIDARRTDLREDAVGLLEIAERRVTSVVEDIARWRFERRKQRRYPGVAVSEAEGSTREGSVGSV